jgi:predicted GIY-YIG superfamily endonuclease
MALREQSWFVYIARCADGSLYTGTARDVGLRIAAHNAGKGARYTRARRPIVLCAKQRCASRGDALRLELAVKRLARDEKVWLLGPRRLAGFARRMRGRSA